MGEAKRRKQLGLMPTVQPFEAQVNEQNEVTLTRSPNNPELREKILAALQKHYSLLRSWPRRYRREYVMAGMPQKLLKTAADVEAIEVPRFRRMVGEVLDNYDPRTGSQSLAEALRLSSEYIPLDEQKEGRGSWLHFKEEHSFDGKQWQTFPEHKHAFEGLRYLMQHPVTEVEGELVNRYQVEQTADGELRFEPELSDEHQTEVKELMRDWFGKTPEEWASQFHEAQNTPTALEPYTDVPRAIRSVVELRQPAPLPGLAHIAMSSVGDLDAFIPFEERSYTLDGEHWLPYEAEREEDDGSETIYTVTVHQDGQLEWDEGDFTPAQEKLLRDILPTSTGAGDPERWASRTQELMLDGAEGQLAVPDGQHLPVPQQVKLDFSDELWWLAPEEQAASIMLSEVTFDGEHWHEIYSDEWEAAFSSVLIQADQAKTAGDHDVGS